MKLSIVTVCYNAEKTIEETLISVLNQSFTDYEYIFIDGASNDNTYKIIRKYIKDFNAKGIKCTLISEPDNGIYDAMNKGALLASGEWITYMNADDSYYNDRVLEQVFNKEIDDSVCLLYGNTYFNKPGENAIVEAKPYHTITHHLPFCPQAAFVRTSVQKELQFDCNFSISADYDFFLRLFLKDQSHIKLNITVAIFNWGGASNVNLPKTYREDTLVKIKNKIVSRYSPIVYLKWAFFILRWIFNGSKINGTSN